VDRRIPTKQSQSLRTFPSSICSSWRKENYNRPGG
jgi:hypothetical protein